MRLLSAFLLIAVSCAAAEAPPLDLRCEYAANPLGLDSERPHLAWRLNDSRRGAAQTAYRVLVASNPENMEADRGDIWDSGRVQSDESVQIRYSGAPLRSARRYYWKVRIWDHTGQVSPWSAPAWWETGLLSPGEWTAHWIGAPEPAPPSAMKVGKWISHPAPHGPGQIVYFRRQFEIPAGATVSRAELMVSGRGTSAVELNGEVAAFTDGRQWRLFDIRRELRTGVNRVEAEVHAAPDEHEGLALGARVELKDGRVLEWLTDETWMAVIAEGATKRMPHPVESSAAPAVAGGSAEMPAAVEQGTLEAAPYFRKNFRLRRPVAQARAYICGLGYYELYLNGARVGGHVLDPAQTDYDKRAFYVTYDVTKMLTSGDNAIGVILGDGWFHQKLIWGGMSYGRPRLLLQLSVVYDNGERETLLSDRSWKCTQDGPVRGNNVYWGEDFDATKVLPGWDRAAFDDSHWSPAREIAPPAPRLESQMLPPIRKTRTLKPRTLTEPRPGVYVFDMGQNFAGWARLHVQARRGVSIRLRFAEMLGPDGMLAPISTGSYFTHVVQRDRYVASGRGVETWEPRFTYHGFRYVEVTGLSQKPGLDLLEGIVVHTAAEPVGKFECSDPLLNRIHQAALWTMSSNMHGLPTDCPARERCGWTGDAQLVAEMAMYNFDSASFFSKYVQDMETSLHGGLPTLVAPGKRGKEVAAAEWGSAWIQVPWSLYEYYGDRRPLERAYPYWRAWLEHLRENLNGEGVLPDDGYWRLFIGDHHPPGGTPNKQAPDALCGTTYVGMNAALAARAARLLGHDEDARAFDALASQVKTAWIRKYYRQADASFGSQTADSLALAFDLAPEGSGTAVAHALAADVTTKHGGHFTTGILGSRYLYDMLSDQGYGSAAYDLLTRKDYPSWGFLLALGATTMWEDPGQNATITATDTQNDRSLNHPMHAAFDEWFYSRVAGIQLAADRPGFKHTILRPDTATGLRWATASYRSVQGTIESAWLLEDGSFRWHIVVPANTTATAYVPAVKQQDVREGGRPAAQAQGIRYAGFRHGRAVYEIASGTYEFVSRVR